ncbi:zinc finger protein 771-like [Aricia agestis]|uniref:zinc finger protein 771-like n=1 Tax=Aricia agestis TaxID=91739 RepID=UPI001C2064C7|nr:zinc finger protein 771-like [Aricia agestis]
MKNTFCYLCLAANRRTLNIYKTDLQYVYESLAYYKITDGECWMCYICHTRLQQCLRLQQLAVQTRGLIDGHNKINIDLKVLGSLLELSIYRTKNISIPHYTSRDIQEPEAKNQLDLKLESTNDSVIDHNVESSCDYEGYEQFFIEYDDPLLINDNCKTDLPVDRNASSNEVQSEVSQVNYEYVQQTPTTHTIKEEYFEGLGSQNAARCTEQRSVEEMQQHIEVEIEYLGNKRDANEQERDNLMESKSHSKKKPHHCEVCSKTFTCRSLLLQHARKHTGEKPFRCHICQKEFTRKVNLNTHIETHSGLKPFSCHICPKKFAAKFNLSKHIRTHAFQKAFTCEVCQNKFSRKGYLKTHQLLHTGDKPFNCDICSRSFSQKKTLKYHILSHMNVKPYTCNVCHRKFAQKGDLNRHLRVHTGERPHGCHICHKKFSHKSNLKKHTLIHSNIKPFSCAIVDVVSLGAEVQ